MGPFKYRIVNEQYTIFQFSGLKTNHLVLKKNFLHSMNIQNCKCIYLTPYCNELLFSTHRNNILIQNISRNTHLTKKRLFIFGGKATPQKFLPHPEGEKGVTFKFQMGTFIFYCRFGISIKRYVNFIPECNF